MAINEEEANRLAYRIVRALDESLSPGTPAQKNRKIEELGEAVLIVIRQGKELAKMVEGGQDMLEDFLQTAVGLHLMFGALKDKLKAAPPAVRR